MDITKERVVAIARLCVMLVSAVAGGFGLTVDADSLYTVVACGIALGSALWCWYRNNNLTEAAAAAQAYLDTIKGGLHVDR